MNRSRLSVKEHEETIACQLWWVEIITKHHHKAQSNMHSDDHDTEGEIATEANLKLTSNARKSKSTAAAPWEEARTATMAAVVMVESFMMVECFC